MIRITFKCELIKAKFTPLDQTKFYFSLGDQVLNNESNSIGSKTPQLCFSIDVPVEENVQLSAEEASRKNKAAAVKHNCSVTPPMLFRKRVRNAISLLLCVYSCAFLHAVHFL